MEIKKNKRGITLLALVITVIVLTILLTIAVNMFTGDDGILDAAESAKDNVQSTQTQVQKRLNEIYNSSRTDGVIRSKEDEVRRIKELIAEALTEAGQTTSPDETVEEMANKIKNLAK